MSFLLIYKILLLAIFTKLISLIGVKIIGNFAWDIYLKVSPSQETKHLRSLRRKAVDVYTKRGNVSSKDEFAKWAKLDREYTKTRNEVNELTEKINNSKSAFLRMVSTAFFLITSGLKLFCRVYYRKQPVNWLPNDLLPGPVLSILAFPSAPKGSVSVNAWIFIVDSALSTFISFLRSLWAFKQTPAENVNVNSSVPPTAKAQTQAQAQSYTT